MPLPRFPVLSKAGRKTATVQPERKDDDGPADPMPSDELDFSSSNVVVEEPQPAKQTVQLPTTVIEEESKKPKPQGKVSPFTTMQNKLNFIPRGQRDNLNTRYLATLPGALKIIELLIGFAAFVLSICADRNATTSAWTEHITFETTIVVAALIIGYVIFPHLTLADERTRNGLVVLELIFYGLNTGAYFIAVWLMVHLSATWNAGNRGAAVICAVVLVALTVVYGIETFIKFKAWNGEEVTKKKTNEPAPANNGHFPTTHELSKTADTV